MEPGGHADGFLAAFLGFGPADVFVDALGGGAARHGQHVGEGGEAGHGHEVGGGVEAGRLHHLGQDGDAVVVRQEQGVAIGGGGFQGLRGDLAAGAGTVFHHHRGTQFVLEFFAQGAGDGVGAGTGGEAHQQLDGGVAGGLGGDQAGEGAQDGQGTQGEGGAAGETHVGLQKKQINSGCQTQPWMARS